MTKIDIISGFLGAGKTTLIKKLLSEAFTGEQVVLIENEFGEIGIDGGFLKESGIEIREMNSGCICCSLVGDFGKSLREVVDTYHPDSRAGCAGGDRRGAEQLHDGGGCDEMPDLPQELRGILQQSDRICRSGHLKPYG